MRHDDFELPDGGGFVPKQKNPQGHNFTGHCPAVLFVMTE
jgi:hypothetical protein